MKGLSTVIDRSGYDVDGKIVVTEESLWHFQA